MEDNFAEILKGLIDSTGLSVIAVSKATGISNHALQNYINRKCLPNLDTLVKLADYFAVPLDYLAGRCDEETAQGILADYPKRFMELRRAPYEAYLVGRTKNVNTAGAGESPWPYNLLGELTREPWVDLLGEDNLAGLEKAMQELTERERNCILMYYLDGMTLETIGKNCGVTGNRIRQIIQKAVRKLRAPHRMNLILYGEKGAEERNHLKQRRAELDREAAELAEYAEKLKAAKKALDAEKPEVPDIVLDKKAEIGKTKAMSLEYMDLSVRAYNCLKRCGCKTVGDVMNLATQGKLMMVRNLGRKSYDEVLDRLYTMTGIRYGVTEEAPA